MYTDLFLSSDPEIGSRHTLMNQNEVVVEDKKTFASRFGLLNQTVLCICICMFIQKTEKQKHKFVILSTKG